MCAKMIECDEMWIWVHKKGVLSSSMKNGGWRKRDRVLKLMKCLKKLNCY